MEYFEVYLCDIWEVNLESEFKEFLTENWSRFLDDCTNPLDRKKVQTQELLETISTISEVIQFTMEYSDKEIQYLDIIIKRDSSGLWMV